MATLMMIFTFACSIFLIGVLTKNALFNNKSISSNEKDEVDELKQRNHELEMRMETLETIVTSIDPELLGGLLEMNSTKKRVPKNVTDKMDKIKNKEIRENFRSKKPYSPFDVSNPLNQRSIKVQSFNL